MDVQTCGCADLYMGKNASSAYMEPGGRVCTQSCVPACKIMEVGGLKAVVENSPLMFWHMAEKSCFHAQPAFMLASLC